MLAAFFFLAAVAGLSTLVFLFGGFKPGSSVSSLWFLRFASSFCPLEVFELYVVEKKKMPRPLGKGG